MEEYNIGTSRPYRRNVSSSFTGSQIIPSSHRSKSGGGGNAFKDVGMSSIRDGSGQVETQSEYLAPMREMGEDASMSE